MLNAAAVMTFKTDEKEAAVRTNNACIEFQKTVLKNIIKQTKEKDFPCQTEVHTDQNSQSVIVILQQMLQKDW